MKQRIALWEPEARSVLRIIVALLLTLHGLRTAFGLFVAVAGRRLSAGRGWPRRSLPVRRPQPSGLHTNAPTCWSIPRGINSHS